MSIYRGIDPLGEHITQRDLKGRREREALVNVPTLAYPNQHIDIKILAGSREHVIGARYRKNCV